MIKLSSRGGKRRVKVSLLSRPGATEVTAAVFAGRRRGQTRTLPIFNLASYHGRQSRPLDADLIKDNERSRSVSDSSLLLRCPNKTLPGKWWQCYLGEGFNQCLGFSLSVVTVTVTVDEGGGRRLERNGHTPVVAPPPSGPPTDFSRKHVAVKTSPRCRHR